MAEPIVTVAWVASEVLRLLLVNGCDIRGIVLYGYPHANWEQSVTDTAQDSQLRVLIIDTYLPDSSVFTMMPLPFVREFVVPGIVSKVLADYARIGGRLRHGGWIT